ncbi:MAG: hypothetical protein ACKV2U_13610 [Bryobacteraceae bacterium]
MKKSEARFGAFIALVLSTLFIHCPSAHAQAAGPQTAGAKPPGPQPIGAVTQRWTGTLFDTTRKGCGVETKGASPADTCPVSVCTLTFGIRLPDGKLYNFDESGNPKAASALQKSRKGSRQAFSYWQTGKAAKPITATVTGSVTSDLLNLDTIRID